MPRVRKQNETMSIARLAKHLGLSEGTVSRALNNYPDIAAKTVARVRKAADELGYRPRPPHGVLPVAWSKPSALSCPPATAIRSIRFWPKFSMGLPQNWPCQTGTCWSPPFPMVMTRSKSWTA